MTPIDQERSQRWCASLTRCPRSLLAFLILCALLVVAGIPLWNAQKWIGVKARLLTLNVNDANSGAPLANAEVVVFRGYVENPGWTAEPDIHDAETAHVLTGADGTARLPYEFQATGTSYPFLDTGAIHFSDRFVRVAADGYQPDVFRLGSRIGESRDIHDERPITILVELKR